MKTQTAQLRKAELSRKTGETDIVASINLDGTGKAEIKTGYNFLDHMLTLLSWFSFFDIKIAVKSDISLQPDDHHIVEDVGIVLGQLFRRALGEMTWGDVKGIKRYGCFAAPTDDCLVNVAVDIYTRYFAAIELPCEVEKIGDVSVQSLIHFFEAFAQEAKIVLHINTLHNGNPHHLFESAFKSLAKALDQATSFEPRLELKKGS